jgi:ApbE superfamily uncharacterized protein (UPF0280 family)
LRAEVGNNFDLGQAEAATVLAEGAFKSDEVVQCHQVLGGGSVDGGETDDAMLVER